MTTGNQVRDSLLLAQRVIGVTNMGFSASPRIAKQAFESMDRLHQSGQCHTPAALSVLKHISGHALLPGQAQCSTALQEISAVLKPINAEFRAHKLAAREDAGESHKDRMRG